ncbi:hypothetical protein PQR34_42875 [Paraburkholderia sediminicola]|uniref:hypothetical protein n=1 Tax=Paraburkholderia sediminicola TaxID=458836 RepID=UPI0038B8C566
MLHNTKAGTIDVHRAMLDLADRMKTLQQRDPGAARNLARSLGVEQLLPVLIQGRAGMQAYEAEARRLRGDFTPQMAARAQAFAQSLNMMGVAADGLKSSIADSLVPVLKPLIDRFTEWIAKNRELISQRVASLVERIAKWLVAVNWDRFGLGVTNAVNALIDFAKQALEVVQAIGGWKAVMAGVVLMMGGPLIGTIVQLGAVLVRLGALAWANPIIAAIGMIALLSYEVYKHWNDIGEAMANATPPAFGDGTDGKAPVGGWGKLGDYFGWNKKTTATNTPNKPNAPQGDAPVPAAALNEMMSAAAPRVGTDADGGLLVHLTNFADAINQGGAYGAVGSVATRAAGVGASVRQWAARLDFAGKEARYGLAAGLLGACTAGSQGVRGCHQPGRCKGPVPVHARHRA